MSLTTQNYLQQGYLSTPYQAATAQQSFGAQVKLVILAAPASHMQVADDIVARLGAQNVQVKSTITPAKAPRSTQVSRSVAAAPRVGAQVKDVVAATPGEHQQVKRVVAAAPPASTQVSRTVAATPRVGAQVKDVVAAVPGEHQQVARFIVPTPAFQSQVSRTILQPRAGLGSQVAETVAASLRALSSQVARRVATGAAHTGSQVADDILLAAALHAQVRLTPLSSPGEHQQVYRRLAALGPVGMTVLYNTFLHAAAPQYLVYPYLATAYLVNTLVAQGRFQVQRALAGATARHSQVADDIVAFPAALRSQVLRVLVKTPALSSQVARQVAARLAAMHAQVAEDIIATPGEHQQVSRTILALRALSGQVARFVVARPQPTHAQVQRVIAALKATSAQVLARVLHATPTAQQVRLVHVVSQHMQTTLVLYNTTNLRVLDRFPSRGTSGTNWTASSTAAGDFSVNNLNNDIVEFCWRSAASTTNATLTSDTQVPQGVFVDTVGILGHNFTLSAVVVLQGSNDPTFATVGTELTMETSLTNMYYIAPLLPAAGYRYWRFVVSDPTNPAGFLQVGTIVFGAALIMIGEDIVDQIKFSRKHFKDVIPTEGFTNVSNDRALRRTLGLQFKDMDFQKANYIALSGLFDYARTSLKCLWIPTPRYPTRFALFGKLSQLPEEVHNDKGEDLNYIDLNLEIDESL